MTELKLKIKRTFSGEFSREPESYYGMKKIPKIKIKPDLAKLKVY